MLTTGHEQHKYNEEGFIKNSTFLSHCKERERETLRENYDTK